MNPICIVDDQPHICSTVSAILADEGYKTIVFQDAESFWQSLDTQEPSLVLLDIWLPGVDGLELLKRLHERFPYSRASIKGVFDLGDLLVRKLLTSG